MTRDEIYKHVGRPIDTHPVLELFEIRTSENAKSFEKVDLFAVHGACYPFDYVETSLVLPNEVVAPEFVTGMWFRAAPTESFEGWSVEFVVDGSTVASFSANCMTTTDVPHRLDRPVLIRPGDRISAVFEGPEVKAGSIALKLYGFEVAYSVLPDVTHFAPHASV